MSRPLRIQYPNAWYHVMNRGRRGEALFSNEADYLAFIQLLKEVTGMWDIRIAAFCLMSNHYHLLLQTPNANLSRCMRHINGVYTQRYNRRYNLDGSLFRGRYKAILIDEDTYLLEAVRYIHRNPLNAGLVDQLKQYPWSSHNGYLSSSKKWSWLYKEYILSMFSKNKESNKELYRQFINRDEANKVKTVFMGKKLPAILGSKVFIQRIKDTYGELTKKQEVPESRLLCPSKEKIKKVVCEVYDVESEDLRVIRRGRFNEPRNIAIYLMRQLRGENLKQIGKEFNITNYSTVSSVLSAVRNRFETDKDFKKQIYEIKRKISQKQT